MPAGHSETQILGLMHSLSSTTWSRPPRGTSPQGRTLASGARKHAMPHPTAAQTGGRCHKSHPTHHHPLSMSPTGSETQRPKPYKDTRPHNPLQGPSEHCSRRGTCTAPKSRCCPCLLSLGPAAPAGMDGKGASRSLCAHSPPFQNR